jgi:hypothetical protein
MRMLRLGRRRRDVAAQALREMGTLIAAGVVVNQFISRESLSPCLVVAGFLIWVGLVSAAIACTEEREHE